MRTRLTEAHVAVSAVARRLARSHAEARVVVVVNADPFVSTPKSRAVPKSAIALGQGRIAQKSCAAIRVDLARITYERSAPREG